MMGYSRVTPQRQRGFFTLRGKRVLPTPFDLFAVNQIPSQSWQGSCG